MQVTYWFLVLLNENIRILNGLGAGRTDGNLPNRGGG